MKSSQDNSLFNISLYSVSYRSRVTCVIDEFRYNTSIRRKRVNYSYIYIYIRGGLK